MVRFPSNLNGLIWSGVNAGSAVLMPMAIFVFFARTATPEMIGTVVMAVSCLELLKCLALPGLYEAVLQQTDDQRRCHETVAFVVLAAAGCLFLGWLAGLHGFGRFVPAVAAHEVAFGVLGSRIVLDLAALQPQARLAQLLAYRRLAMRSLVSMSLGGAIGVAGASLADPFTGLIAYQVAQSALFLLATMPGTAAWPRLHRVCLQRMWREATLATGVRLLAASVGNLDQIIAAMLLGSVPLAFYNLGKRIESASVTAAGSFSTILFQPLFACHRSTRREPDLLPGGIAVVTIVLGLPVATFVANSPVLVSDVFGPTWNGASVVAAVMAVAGCVRAVGFVPGAFLSVTVRNRELFMISLTSVLGAALLMMLAAPFGIVWCASALLALHLGILGWMLRLVRHATAPPVSDFLTAFVVPFVLMLLGASLGRRLLGSAPIAHGAFGALLSVAGSAVVGAAVITCYAVLRLRRQLVACLLPARGELAPQS